MKPEEMRDDECSKQRKGASVQQMVRAEGQAGHPTESKVPAWISRSRSLMCRVLLNREKVELRGSKRSHVVPSFFAETRTRGSVSDRLHLQGVLKHPDQAFKSQS